MQDSLAIMGDKKPMLVPGEEGLPGYPENSGGYFRICKDAE